MNKLLTLIAVVLSLTGHLRAQSAQGGSADIAGTLYASNFANWTVAQGTNGPYSWATSSTCTQMTAGGVTFKPFTVGTPIRIVDTSVPATSETVTVEAVNVNGSGCSITVSPPASKHYSFYLTSATVGLQEAINYANRKPAVVALTPA